MNANTNNISADMGKVPWQHKIALALVWKRNGIVLMLLDSVTIFTVFIAAYYSRTYLGAALPSLVEMPGLEQYVKGGVLLTVVWVLLIWQEGGYETGLLGMSSPIMRIRTLVMCGIYALFVLMVISFLYREMLLSRIVYVSGSFFAAIAMISTRYGFKMINKIIAEKKMAVQKVVVIGMSDEIDNFIDKLKTSALSVELAGIINWKADDNPKNAKNYTVLGDLSQIRDIYEKTRFNKLIIPSADQARITGERYSETIMETINFCEEKEVTFYMVPGSYDIAVAHHEVGSFSGLPLVRLRDASIYPAYAFIKRIMDVTLSLLILFIGLPAWIYTAYLVKKSGDGPVIFTQTRVGLHGRLFKMYKFRSMVADAEEKLKYLVDIDNLKEPVFKIENDPRVTPLGIFLRKTGLDEIPQLINVLKGEMSIVGPRPEEQAIVEKYDQWQARRLKTKPGITGYQQINNRGEPRLSERIKYDLIYLKHQSILLDVYIMFKTVWVVLAGKGVTH